MTTEEIKIKIEASSELGQFILKRMAEKKVFKEATAGLNLHEFGEYCKKNNIKFYCAVDPQEL
jgi:hypothetical protein